MRPAGLAQIIAFVVGAMLVCTVDADATAIPAGAQPLSSSIPLGQCWIEEPPTAPRTKPATKRKRVKKSVKRHPQKARRSVATRAHPVPARPSKPRKIELRWVCLPLRPPQGGITPFSYDLAQSMRSTPGDATFQQWIVDRSRRRPRYWSEEAVSLAPEPAGWLMMIGGFALIGWSIRRTRNLKALGHLRMEAPRISSR